MSATTYQAIRLIDCPVCGKPIELKATYDVRFDQSTDVSAAAKVAKATLTMTGVYVNHECPPISVVHPPGGIIINNPATRKD